MSTESSPGLTPWEVPEQTDYNNIVEHWGASFLTPTEHGIEGDDLVDTFQQATQSKPHIFLRRGIFYSHRDFDKAIDEWYNAKEAGVAPNMYIYTGRGPSSSALHLGHLVPMKFTVYLQKVLQIPLVLQLTDDEKFLWKDLTLAEASRLGRENTKDIIALGLDPERSFLFLDTEYMDKLYPTVLDIQSRLTYNMQNKVFGHSEEAPVGRVAFPAIQMAPCFPSVFTPEVFSNMTEADTAAMRCLIPCAIDQDPYFRACRDIMRPMGQKHSCSLIHSEFLPPLSGLSKMSASNAISAIYVTDTLDVVEHKINANLDLALEADACMPGFSENAGYAPTKRELCAKATVQWLRFFLEDDDLYDSFVNKLFAICDDGEEDTDDADFLLKLAERRAGELVAFIEEIRPVLVKTIVDEVRNFQTARAAISDEDVEAFFSRRPMKREPIVTE